MVVHEPGGPGNDAYYSPADTLVALALENGLSAQNEYKCRACEFL